jgi:regulator of RNase E activity RraA
MPSLPPLTDETLEVLRKILTQTLIDALWVKNWPMSMIEGARPLQPGQRMAGRAVTLRFVPHRPDLAADPKETNRRSTSPLSSAALEKCWSLTLWAGNTVPLAETLSSSGFISAE